MYTIYMYDHNDNDAGTMSTDDPKEMLGWLRWLESRGLGVWESSITRGALWAEIRASEGEAVAYAVGAIQPPKTPKVVWS